MTLFLILILILMLTNPHIVSFEVYNACVLWFTTLLPTMYPSFVVIDMIYHMPLIYKFSSFLYKPFKFIFHISSSKSVFLILISLICGAPASTKLIVASYEKKEISKREYTNLICAFSTLSMPYTILILQQYGISIWKYYLIVCLLAWIWMFLFQRKEKTNLIPVSFESDYLNLFFTSVKKNMDILLNILGILIIIRVLTAFLFPKNFILYPYLEILGGLENPIAPIVALSAMGFLGVSIHFQMLYIMKDIPYYKFLVSRLFFLLVGIVAFL